ncbi:MAG: DUF4783 domain-containing protein [Ignavibacteriales bacterium]
MKTLLLLISFAFLVSTSLAQDTVKVAEQSSAMPDQIQINTAIAKIESGMAQGKASMFNDVMGSAMIIRISNMETRNVSASHACRLLDDYFTGKESISFTFTSVPKKDLPINATGKLSYLVNGKRNNMFVLVTLIPKGNRVRIDAIKIGNNPKMK